MAMTINTNIQSLNAQRNLGASQSSLSTSMQRLSSGMRINSAKDDAAGLAIAERMSAQVRGLNQAQRNANDGVSLAQTAEGALSTIGGNLQRIRELAVQSRNATNSTEDRAALQKEVDQLKSEIDRVATDTSFNGTKLLDGSFTAKAFQVGANQGQLISIDSIQNAKIDQLGSWTSSNVDATMVGGVIPTTAGTDLTVTAGSGSFDLSAITVDATSGVGSFTLNIGGQAKTITATAYGADDAATRAAVAAKVETAFEEVSGLTATVTGSSVAVSSTNSNAFSVSVSQDGNNAVPGGVASAVVGAVSGQKYDYAATTIGINGKTLNIGAATSATERANSIVKAVNDQFSDGTVKASLVDGKVVLTGKDADVDVTAAGTNTGLTVSKAQYTKGSANTGFNKLDISTTQGADDAILAMDAALKSVNSARADLGAIQNRFESVVSNLSVNSENLSASKSRITDADFAAETANLSRSQILQQAGTAMVAQANQLPQGVLSLLR